MALALFMMPGHQSNHPLATSAAPMGGMSGHMDQMAVDGGFMSVLMLLRWTACAAVLAVPAMRHRRRGMEPHATCSACMTLAMAIMAL